MKLRFASALVSIAMICIASDPSLFQFETARALYRAEQYEAALRHLETSEEANEPATLRPLYRGMCLAQLGRWQEAENQLAPFLQKNPAEAEGWYWLGASQYYTQKFEAAQQSLNKAIALRPQDADAHRMHGLVYLHLKQWNDAYQEWLTAVRLNPRDAKSLYYIGRLFHEANRLDQARSWLEKTLHYAPRHFEALTYLGLCEENLGNTSRAVDLYSQAIDESMTAKKPYSWAFLSLAKLRRKLGQPDESRELLERGAKLDPEPHLLQALGQALIDAKEYSRAEPVLREAIMKDPQLPEAHYQLSRVLSFMGHRQAAAAELELFRKTKTSDKDRPRITVVSR